MKRKVIILLGIIFIMMISTIFVNINFSYAKVTTNDPTVQTGENVSITVSTTTPVSCFKIQLVDAGGLTFKSASKNSNFENGSSKGSTINGATTGQSSTTLATYTFKAPEVTETKKYTVTFKISGMDNEEDTTNISTVTVKPKTTNAPTTGGTTGNNTGTTTGGTTSGGNATTNPTKPTFKETSKTVYATKDINLRASWSTSSTATSIEKGTELRLTGTSTEKINGYVWYRVTYNGQTKYVSKDLITETKPEEKSNNANLKSLEIEGVELTPVFNTDITEYSVKLLDYEQNEIKIVAEVEDEKSSVKVEGNTNIIDGENVITVTVTAEDGTTKIYTISAVKEFSTIFGLTSLAIKDVELKDFSSEKYNYEIEFKELEKLEIEAIASEKDATIEILGNENLVEGENLITIIVTSADGSKTVTYQIKANKLVIAEQVKKLNMEAIIISAIIALVVLIVIIILITKYVKHNNIPIVDYEYSDNLENNTQEKDDTEFANEIMPQGVDTKKEKASKLLADDIDEKQLKRGKGKHSK